MEWIIGMIGLLAMVVGVLVVVGAWKLMKWWIEGDDIADEVARTGHWSETVKGGYYEPKESRAERMRVINEERAKLGQRPLR